MALLHKGFATRTPQAFADAGVELVETDRQQAGEEHQRQADVQTLISHLELYVNACGNIMQLQLLAIAFFSYFLYKITC